MYFVSEWKNKGNRFMLLDHELIRLIDQYSIALDLIRKAGSQTGLG